MFEAACPMGSWKEVPYFAFGNTPRRSNLAFGIAATISSLRQKSPMAQGQPLCLKTTAAGRQRQKEYRNECDDREPARPSVIGNDWVILL